jgi:chromosome segregation ATPase
MFSDIPVPEDKTEELEKERNEVISKIKDHEKNYSSGDMLDEEYEELRRPLDEKINKLDEELKRLKPYYEVPTDEKTKKMSEKQGSENDANFNGILEGAVSGALIDMAIELVVYIIFG